MKRSCNCGGVPGEGAAASALWCITFLFSVALLLEDDVSGVPDAPWRQGVRWLWGCGGRGVFVCRWFVRASSSIVLTSSGVKRTVDAEPEGAASLSASRVQAHVSPGSITPVSSVQREVSARRASVPPHWLARGDDAPSWMLRASRATQTDLVLGGTVVSMTHTSPRRGAFCFLPDASHGIRCSACWHRDAQLTSPRGCV